MGVELNNLTRKVFQYNEIIIQKSIKLKLTNKYLTHFAVGKKSGVINQRRKVVSLVYLCGKLSISGSVHFLSHAVTY